MRSNPLRLLLLALVGLLVGWLLWSELEGAGLLGERERQAGERAERGDDLEADLVRRARLRGLPGIASAERGRGRVVGCVERLVAGHGTRPLPDVELELIGVSGKKREHRSTRTNVEGCFTFEKVPACVGYALLIRQTPWRELVRRGVNVARNRTTDVGVLLLGAPTSLRGEVVDAAGRRVGGASVWVFPDRRRAGRIDLVRGLRELQAAQEPLAEAETDKSGAFCVDGISPGRYVLRVQAKGYATVFHEGVWVSADERSGATRIVLDPGAGFYGRTLDAEGRPLPAARVIAVVVAGKRVESLDRVETVSDAQGRYRLDSLIPSLQYVVEAWSVGYAPAGQLLTPTGLEELDLVLTTGGQVTGLVTEEGSGLPIPDAEVMLVAGRLDALSPLTTRTDVEGRYTFDNVSAGSVALFGAKAEGHPSRSFGLGERLLYRVASGETTLINVSLPGGIGAEGFVLDERGRPVPYATVEFLDPRRKMEGGRTALTDVDGAWRLMGLRATTYEVRIQATGFAPLVQDADARLKVEAPGPLRHDITLERGGVLEGVVSTPDGAPLGGVRIRIQAEGRRRIRERVEVLVAITAASGAWRILGIPPHTGLRVEASHPDWASVRSAALRLTPGATTKVDLALGEGTNVAGRVADRTGRLLEGARVRWGRIPQGDEGRLKDAHRADRYLLPRVVRTAGDGTFRIPRLEPGRWLVKVEHADHAPWYRKDLVIGEAGSESLDVVMEATVQVEGRVLAADTARPVADAWLYAREQAPAEDAEPESLDPGRVRALGSARTDEHGRYRIEGLPPDRVYEIVLWIAPGFQSALTHRKEESVRVRDVRGGAHGIDFRAKGLTTEEASALR